MDDGSVTGRAYALLRSDIIACRLAPGSRLNVLQLQKGAGLSQAAIREALSRLAAEGLVEIERNRGFRVSDIANSGFRKLTEALLAVELPCLRAAIANGDTEWELNLVSTYHRAVRTLELVVDGKADLDVYANERLSFYEALLSASDNPWMMSTWRLLYAQNARYRQVYMPLAKFELNLNPHHEQILKAVLARDVEKAISLSIENYEQVSQFIEDQMSTGSQNTKAPSKPKPTPKQRAKSGLVNPRSSTSRRVKAKLA